jgi:RNA polymerase sigma-70 factor (ECF subfamily)
MNKKPDNQNNSSAMDADLIRDFQSGNKMAFDNLVLRHKDKVFNLCYWYLQDYQEANEQAQETFIKVFKGLKKFRFESSFSTWLHRITINTCKNRIKSMEYRFRKKTDSLDNPEMADHFNPGSGVNENTNSPDRALEKKQRSAFIRKAINDLPESKKTMIVLRDIEGLSYEEIASITGLKQGTVKSKIARARDDLKNKLKEAF